MLSGYQFTVGGVIMLIMGAAFGGKVHAITGQGIVMLCYLGFISAAAYSVWGILLKYNPVSKVTVFGFENPVFGFILSALLLEEKNQALGIKSLVALVLVSLGIFIVNSRKREG